MAFQRFNRQFDPAKHGDRPTEAFKISRSKIDMFIKCARCMYLDVRLGVKQPDSYPLTLNIAVDALLKKEFDTHRVARTAHPYMKAYGIDAVPFEHPKMEEWRHNFTGVQYVYPGTNFLVFGAVDDIWVNPAGELIVVDYKATSKASEPSLDGDLGAQYRRQMEVYQWLLSRNGFAVSPTGYFVYVNGDKDKAAFDKKLEFKVSVLPCEGDSAWVEPTLAKIKSCLMSDELPESNTECQYCNYRLQAARIEIPATTQKATKPRKPKTPGLF